MLPPEIVDDITQYIWPTSIEIQIVSVTDRKERKHTLSALASTCSSYGNIVQPYLFRFIRLNTPGNCEELCVILQRKPHLGVSIRDLVFSDKGRREPQMFTWLESVLKHVGQDTVLTLVELDTEYFKAKSTDRWLPSKVKLMGGSLCYSQDLKNVLSCFPRLQDLTLRGLQTSGLWSPTEFSAPVGLDLATIEPRPSLWVSRLKSLSLGELGDEASSEALMSPLLAHLAIAVGVENLTIRICSKGDAEVFRSILRDAKSTLRQLHLDIQFDLFCSQGFDDLEDSLAGCHKLEYIKYKNCKVGQSFDWFVRLLRSLPVHHAMRNVDLRVVNCNQTINWKGVDGLMAYFTELDATIASLAPRGVEEVCIAVVHETQSDVAYDEWLVHGRRPRPVNLSDNGPDKFSSVRQQDFAAAMPYVAEQGILRLNITYSRWQRDRKTVDEQWAHVQYIG